MQATTPPTLTDCPFMNTRSSQSPPPQSQESTGAHPNSLYEIVLDPLIKDTVGQRNTSAIKLAPYVCGGSTWSEIQTKIFTKFKTKCLGLAERNDDGAWAVLDDDISESHFGRIFALRYGSHTKKLEDESKMNEWLVSIRSARISLSIYKYGNEVATKDQLVDFTARCVAPRNQDRSGAPTEATIQEYMAKLHTKWDDTWEAAYPIWRIWATYVVKPPLLAWESRVQQMPPPHVLARLKPRISGHQVRMESFHRHIRSALDVVDASLAELDDLAGAVDIVVHRLKIFQRGLANKREVLVSMETDLAPIPHDEVVTTELNDIENIDDMDHDYTMDDME
ncbi:hypothetical protein AaE_015372 [Aphanomyces astaci]|uniref:Uncharacterized protein n=1 Tax=Aphanomyces astaci TaxID=112090 RepID=A0A6A4YW95_APHAT|nr:hypothetical protein AaE_015372 [Aphanomyces astaci]